jgi:hypothetical protein
MTFRSPHDRLMTELRVRGGRHPAGAVALVVALSWVGLQTGWMVDHWSAYTQLGWFQAVSQLCGLCWIGIRLCVALLLLVEWAFPSGRPASDA